MGQKKGFTLIEMIVTIAIILILSGVVVVSVFTWTQRTEDRVDTIDEKVEDYDHSKDEVEGWLGAPVP